MSIHHKRSYNKTSISKKKWFLLTAVGTALLLIPRRSSRQAEQDLTLDESAHTQSHKDSEKNINAEAE